MSANAPKLAITPTRDQDLEQLDPATITGAAVVQIAAPATAPPVAAGERPLAFEPANLMWNMRRVPSYLADGVTPHPARTSAIFVVHGMGQQHWTQTSAQLRAGMEGAGEAISEWQQKNPEESAKDLILPPPFILDGFWANYDDLKATFPEDWECFVGREQEFFCNLWKQRVVSGKRTVWWLVCQQLRLLNPTGLWKVGPVAWLLYWPLQIVSTVALLFAWIRFPKLITDYANDVRLYLDPKGVVERAIVQRINERVEMRFMQMIGLDGNFRRLNPAHDELLRVGNEQITFKRVVWVAHSLGTVISYNVLSALFRKADELQTVGDAEQREGVSVFREALTRFVTLGSPLDKVAFLFKEKALHPWPKQQRRGLVNSGETPRNRDPLQSKDPRETEWWINFYHVLDPVSGALDNPLICGNEPPTNIHIRSGWIPGLAHVAYWNDLSALRFILGRTYGRSFLRDKEYRPWPSALLTILAVLSYFVWAVILIGGVYLLFSFGPDLVRSAVKTVFKWITGA